MQNESALSPEITQIKQMIGQMAEQTVLAYYAASLARANGEAHADELEEQAERMQCAMLHELDGVVWLAEAAE
ncbi:MAG: hypothetical protein WDO69_22700 [Pseudomonadota bacterium]